MPPEDDFNFVGVDDADGRLHALVRIHHAVPAIYGAGADIIEPSGVAEDDEDDGAASAWYRTYLAIVEQFAQDAPVSDRQYAVTLPMLRSRGLWADVALAFRSSAARQYFMEQLVLHRYLRHRAFVPLMYNDEMGVPIAWVACDIDSPAAGSPIAGYTPEMPASFTPMHQNTLLTIHVLSNVRAPAELPFAALHELLDRPLYSGANVAATWDDETSNLYLQTTYDPLYFDEIFASDTANAAARTALSGTYAPPLLIHDMLLRNQRVQLKSESGALDAAVAYINDILQTASAPYRAALRRNDNGDVEASYFLRQLYAVISIRF